MFWLPCFFHKKSDALPWWSADTASCNEKTQDCEEMVKSEVTIFSSLFLLYFLYWTIHYCCSIIYLCVKKIQCHQVARLGSKIQQSEDFAKSETRQLKETTDKSMKEVTRTLATLVEQHRSKVGGNGFKKMCVCGGEGVVGVLVVDSYCIYFVNTGWFFNWFRP